MTNKKIERADKKLFYSIIVMAIIEIIAYEIDYYLGNIYWETLTKPIYMRVPISALGYVLRPAIVYTIILLVDTSLRERKKAILLAIPLMVCILSVSTAFYSKLSFWYGIHNEFQRGVLGYVPHIICILYTAICFFVTCKQFKKQERFNSIILILAALFPVFAITLDILVVDTGLSRISIMLCTLIMYIQCHTIALTAMIDEIPGATAKFVVKNNQIKLVMFNELMCYMFGLSYEEFISATKIDSFAVLDEKARKAAKEAAYILFEKDTHSFRMSISSKGIEKIIKVSLRVSQRCDNEIIFYATMIDVTQESHLLDELSMKNYEISLMMNQLGKIICIYDVPTRTLSMSEQYAKIRGYSSTSVIVPDEANERHFVGEESFEAYNYFYSKIHSGEHSGHIIVRFLTPNGVDRWERADFVNIKSEDGKPIRAIISIEDITKSYKERLLLNDYRSTLESLIGDKKLGLLLDLSERKVFACEGGLIPQDFRAEGKTIEELTEYFVTTYVKEKDHEVIREFLNTDEMIVSYNANVMNSYIERLLVMPNKSERYFRITFNLELVNNKIMATLLFEDIDSEYHLHNVLINRANFDFLTGVFTREATMEKIEKFLLGEGQNGTHALVMLDMDNLKSVNNNLGHQFGDTALKDFANKIKHFFNNDDVIGRIGGDEFFAFVKNITGPVLDKKMQLLLPELEQIYSNKEKNILVSASAGVAMYHGDSPKTLKELYSSADAALYRSKASGKNIYTFANENEAFGGISTTSVNKNDLFSYNMKDVVDSLADGIAIFYGKVGQNDFLPAFCNTKLNELLQIDEFQFFTHFTNENNYGIHPDDINSIKTSINDAIMKNKAIHRKIRLKKGNAEYILLNVSLNVRRLDESNIHIICLFSEEDSVE